MISGTGYNITRASRACFISPLRVALTRAGMLALPEFGIIRAEIALAVHIDDGTLTRTFTMSPHATQCRRATVLADNESGKKPMLKDRKQVRRFLEGMVVGGAVLAAVLFGTGFAVRSDIAEHDARQKSQQAVTERLADICIWKYEHAADHQHKLDDLKALDYWKRAEFVEGQGWATMPGDESPKGDVAEECATRLSKLKG